MNVFEPSRLAVGGLEGDRPALAGTWPKLSIIIPVFNEQESLPLLLKEISACLPALPDSEVIIVDDGSCDGTAIQAHEMQVKMPQLRLLRHANRQGQSTATRSGILHATGHLIVTLDGDGQNDPCDIVTLLSAYNDAASTDHPVMVVGRREHRQDSLARRLSSRIANSVRATLLGDGIKDTGCSLKVFRREDFLQLPFFDHIHRFIPAIMKAAGVEIIVVSVSHRPRVLGISKYGTFDRLWVGIHDLVGVRWLIKRMRATVQVSEQ